MNQILHNGLEWGIDIIWRPVAIDLRFLFSKRLWKVETNTYYLDEASFPKVIHNRQAFLSVDIKSLSERLWVVIDSSWRFCALAQPPYHLIFRTFQTDHEVLILNLKHLVSKDLKTWRHIGMNIAPPFRTLTPDPYFLNIRQSDIFSSL